MEILIISDGGETGKGLTHLNTEDIITFTKNYYIYDCILKESNLIIQDEIFDLKNIKTIIFNFNEDLFAFPGVHNNANATANLKKRFGNVNNMIQAFNDISHFIKEKFPNIIIYQDPEKCFELGNKLKVYDRIQHIKNDIFRNIRYKKITNIDDLKNIDFYPIILKKNYGSHNSSDTLCKNINQAKVKWKNYFKRFKNIIAVEFINSYISELSCNASIRLMVTNNNLLDFYCRPSKKWNIHNADQISSKIIYFDNYFFKFYNKNKIEIDKHLNAIHKLYGNGFFAYDIILSNNRLYICEIGIKMIDTSYIKSVKDLKNKLNKISLCSTKLTTYYKKVLLSQ
tara:strand:+ start:19 stop:1041 length:1023 start_codon:yes stop_codon:yes gene_type:complete